MDRGGHCGAAGSEDCEFECLFPAGSRANPTGELP
jgi:hypothetical protein